MGRIPEPTSPSVERYGLSYIRPYHREIARRLVLGEKASSICLGLNMCPSRMSIIINSPLFKLELRRLEQARDADTVDVSKTLRELSPVALEVVERTMYMAKSESLRFSAAQDVLDRAGVAKVSKLVGQVIHDYASMSDEELKKMALERLQRMNQIEQVTKEEIAEAEAITIEFDEVRREDLIAEEPTNGEGNGETIRAD